MGLLAANCAFGALTVTLTTSKSFTGYNGGGEFQAITGGNGTFQTFCIDTHHSFTPGKSYNYTISSHTTTGNISVGTAWLYNEFLNKTLVGYNFKGGRDERDDATLLQAVLWKLEGMSHDNSSSLCNNSNPFYKAVTDEFGSFTKAQHDSGGAYGVYVMNLYSGTNPNCNPAQSQLVRVCVPEPATVAAGVLMLLPLGVSAFRIVRRKKAAQD